jgi:hypothetical protein
LINQKKMMIPPMYGVHLVNNIGASAAVSFETEEVGSYTDYRLLVEEIRRLNCQATFEKGRAPTVPFARVSMDDIRLQLPQNPPQVPLDTHEGVDNRLSCRLSYSCLDERMPGSPLCKIHHKRVQQAVSSQSWGLDVLVSPRRKEVEFTLPFSSVSLRRIKDCINAVDTAGFTNAWFHDAEGIGYTPNPYAGIPTEYGIDNLHNSNKRHSGFLRYPSVQSSWGITQACTRGCACTYNRVRERVASCIACMIDVD